MTRRGWKEGSKERARVMSLLRTALTQVEVALASPSHEKRSQAIARLLKTVLKLSKGNGSKAHAQRLGEILKEASAIEEEFIITAYVKDGPKMYIRGTFDVALLAERIRW